MFLKVVLMENHEQYLHTIVFIDECKAITMDKYIYTALCSGFSAQPSHEYIYAIQFKDINKFSIKNFNFNLDPFKCKPDMITGTGYIGSEGLRAHNDNPSKDIFVASTLIYCRLNQCQRSSQEILEFVDFANTHHFGSRVFSNYVPSEHSFSSCVPIWIEIKSHKDFTTYARKHMSDLKDVLLINFPGGNKWSVPYWHVYRYRPYYRNTQTPLQDAPEIDQLCSDLNWKCASSEVTGSEASTVIVYCAGQFDYEVFTRARNQLIIVTLSTEKE